MSDKRDQKKAAEDMAEYFRQVDAFVNYEDPESIIREQLFKEIEQSGFDSLTQPQKTYHALCCFDDALFNLGLWWFFNNTEADMVEFTALALNELGIAELSDSFQLARSALTGIPDPFECANEINDESYMDAFMDTGNSLTDYILEYAEHHGLFLTQPATSANKM